MFGSLEAVVLSYGYAFSAVTATPQRLAGRKKHCFTNALRAALATLGTTQVLEYCEGFAYVPAMDLVVQHAWLVDDQGHVIDPTWEDAEACGYVGVPVRLDHMITANQARIDGHFGLSYRELYTNGLPTHALQTTFAGLRRSHVAGPTSSDVPRWA